MKKLIATLKNEDWVIVYAGAIVLLLATLFPDAMPSMPKELGSTDAWLKAATMFALVLDIIKEHKAEKEKKNENQR